MKSAHTMTLKKRVPNENTISPATTADLGLTRKDIHDARIMRGAEKAKPGIVRQTLNAALAAGERLSKANVNCAARDCALSATKSRQFLRAAASSRLNGDEARLPSGS